MRIATFNVNSINARLPNLLRWLQQTAPTVVCLQELKAPQEKFPEQAIRDAENENIKTYMKTQEPAKGSNSALGAALAAAMKKGQK